MFGLRMLAVKKSMKRSAAASPRSATIAGTTIAPLGGSMTASAVGFSSSSSVALNRPSGPLSWVLVAYHKGRWTNPLRGIRD